MAREPFAHVVRRRLLGVAYIATIFGLMALSVAVYNKDFSTFVRVTLHTNTIGNALVAESDVKERGVIVGSVRKIQTNGTGATLTLDLNPGRAGIIPNNVTAQILPKTLFGEQYVALNLPSQPGPPIRSGDVISQDKSPGALEAQTVLGDLLPLLQAVKPAELNATLTAVATALQGRGTALGRTLVQFDQYLKTLNPHVPKLVDDLNKLGQVAVEYNAAAPDIIETLNNLQTSSQTLIAKQAAFTSLLTTATSTSDLLSAFLNENQQRLITVVDTSHKIYGLLDVFAPDFGCIVEGMDVIRGRLVKGMQGDQVHLSAQAYNPPPGLGKYLPGEQPRLVSGFGPNCFGLPNPQLPFKIPAGYRCLNDGAALTDDPCSQRAAHANSAGQSALGAEAESSLVNTLIAGDYGVAPDKVPPIAGLLATPALRGSEVTVK